MSWLWATADHSADIVLHADIPTASVAFVNGGLERELWGRTYILEAGVDRLAVAEAASGGKERLTGLHLLGGVHIRTGRLWRSR